MAWGASDYYLVKAWRIMDHGPLNDRPSASSPDRFYYATDNGVLYRDTGTEWEKVASLYGHVIYGKWSDIPTAGTEGRLYYAYDNGWLLVDAATGWTRLAHVWGQIYGDILSNRVTADDARRLFWATDTKELFRDNGSSWERIGSLYGHVYGDVKANRPSAGVEGRLYYSTDTDTLSRDTGAAWEDVSPPATHASQHEPGGSDTIPNVARIATGVYTGDGTESQGITGVGFQPKYVKITNRQVTDGNNIITCWTTDQILDDHADGGAVYIGVNGDTQFITNGIISLDADGFTVDDDAADQHPNKNGFDYNYVCMG